VNRTWVRGLLIAIVLVVAAWAIVWGLEQAMIWLDQNRSPPEFSSDESNGN